MRPAGVHHPVDPILAKVALAIDDDCGNTGTAQPVELLERSSRLLTRAGFGQSHHQVVGVEACAPRGPANGVRLIDVEPLDPSGFEQGAIERVTSFGSAA